ncbi:hypothetical protein EUX98_g7645 [Antrodiella citrinella]|uniref:Uncharacterized protein n=1 Tax=Antrodiella citrinella TaxID=2447956 RepID=A0A4S4ML08_9APHY|nr:hypothetical protein EUX98_g7645 [Antrodiella citrinella]
MSLFATKDLLPTNQMWAEELVQLHDVQMDDAEDPDFVPSTQEGLRMWCTVKQNPDRKDKYLKHMLFMCKTPTNGKVLRAFRLQGFIMAVDVGPMGSWNHEAVQTGVNMPGNSSSYGADPRDINVHQTKVRFGPNWTDSIMLHGSSATNYKPQSKVQSRITKQSRSAADFFAAWGRTPAPLPESMKKFRVDVDRVKRHWIYTRPTIVAALRDDAVHMIHPNSVHVGDFIDVTVIADITTVHTPNGPQLRVRYALEKLIRLQSQVVSQFEVNQARHGAAPASRFFHGGAGNNNVVVQSTAGIADYQDNDMSWYVYDSDNGDNDVSATDASGSFDE